MMLIIVAALVVVLLLWRWLWSRYVAPAMEATAAFSKSSIPFGASFELSISIRNPSWLPAPLVVCELELPDGLSNVAPSETGAANGAASRTLSIALSLRPREEVTLRYTLFGVRRGQHRITTCSLAMSNGFMPNQLYRQVPMQDQMVVHPPKHPFGLDRYAVSRVGTVPAMRKLYPTTLDWVDMRPYRPGDSVRDIHWMTSARRGEMIVLERATSVANHVVVVASAQVSKEFWTPSEPLAEAVYEAAHALLLTLMRDGSMFTLYTNVARRKVTGEGGRRKLMTAEGPWSPRLEFRVGHTLGALPIYAHTGLAQVLAEVQTEVHEPSRILVVTAYEDDEIHRHLQRLQNAGHQVQVIRVGRSGQNLSDGQVAAE